MTWGEKLEAVAERLRENAEYFGAPLTRWQKFRNFIARIARFKEPFQRPDQWGDEQLKQIQG